MPSLAVMTPRELVATASPAIGKLGAAHYFHPDTLAMAKALGLDGFRQYFLGRGGVLGDTSADVVCSAFGYFNPTLIARMWNSAKAVVSPQASAELYLEAAARLGRAKLTNVAGLDEFVAAARAVNDSADAVGLALFAGTRAMGVADDAPAAALQLIISLREHRGGAHLLSVRAAGLDARTAHFIRRPADAELFGWVKDDPGVVVDDAARAMLAEADRITDDLVEPAFAVLDASAGAALVDGLARIGDALAQPAA